MSPSVEPFNEAKYKALMDGLDFQEINKSEVENGFTLGAEYYGQKYVEAVKKVELCSSCKPLGKMWKLMTDGDHGSPDYQDSGVLYLLSESIEEGYINTTKCRYITAEKNNELKRSCLHPRDIVVTKTGVYFGKSAVIPETIPEANTIAHVGKITLKDQYNPYYVSTFLNSKYGYYQLRRRGIKATRPEIKLVEFPDIIIPLFSNTFSNQIEYVIEEAIKMINSSHSKARSSGERLLLLLGYNDGVMDCQSIPCVSQKKYSLSFEATGRMDAEFYQPKYEAYQELVKAFPSGFCRIKDRFSLVKEICRRNEDSYRYVEIGDVDISLGVASSNLIDTQDLPDNAKIIAQKGDLVVSTVRPNRGAVAILDTNNLLVSGAFTVLRQNGNYQKEVLKALLRTPLYKDWILKYNVGTSYPVVKDEDVLNLPIPLFDPDVQDEVIKLSLESMNMKRSADKLLSYAKQAVEMAIEQGEDAALEWLKNIVPNQEA